MLVFQDMPLGVGAACAKSDCQRDISTVFRVNNLLKLHT
jgi:hypothetical protein